MLVSPVSYELHFLQQWPLLHLQMKQKIHFICSSPLPSPWLLWYKRSYSRSWHSHGKIGGWWVAHWPPDVWDPMPHSVASPLSEVLKLVCAIVRENEDPGVPWLRAGGQVSLCSLLCSSFSWHVVYPVACSSPCNWVLLVNGMIFFFFLKRLEPFSLMCKKPKRVLKLMKNPNKLCIFICF